LAEFKSPQSSQGAPSHRLAGGCQSERRIAREGYPRFTWAFHDGEEIGPKMLARIAKHTGLRPEDL
jgi:hypothetical protein